MVKKLIRLTESDLHRIVKESVNRILKEGYYDFYDDFNADDVECPSCGSNNVEPISAIDTHYRCLDCGEEFYLDSGWEPDWGAMRHESHKRKGKTLKEENFGGIPNMIGNNRTSKSHGSNSSDRRNRMMQNRMMQKYNRFNDGSDNPYSDEGRYYRHLETEPQGIGESRYYNPRTYERDESKEFTHDEIKKLVSILKERPIEEMWKPYDLGWCKVQRVEANQTSGRSYLISDPHNMTDPQDMYSDGNNGTIYLQIGRMPNTHWLDESGYTYMCWKW